ncbi:dimethylsulfonioproprionate lyase family protein [Antarcticirhabdus aurantiaca]|uniref:Dimethylsulfonioproprionate lyase family protein n=1 Tax=Antarcticirhabdus aurantiaca TaxID=2606717 RepID=A0ACD4NR55_9HYPH|nr:dimethylsulfonioproprionate lyase family protein [Antarcticirhabdus aurantiaca]WAJ29395.1 dimethylsulfonioproprionate lyase family protein [Jeongeuplla avenae]
MTERDPRLGAFVESLRRAFDAATLEAEPRASMDRIFAALGDVAPAGTGVPARREVCRHLSAAFAALADAPAPLARLARDFAALEPRLAWKPRPAGGPFASDNWAEGHANAMVIGPGGLEERGDVMIGASLLGPHVRYPDHDHGPEETYLVLSPGRFRHGDSDWFEPGIGGTLFNVPNIRHAMASGDAPLLALWCLRV